MNENGMLTRAMSSILCDYRCGIVYNTIQRANYTRADAFRYTKVYWNIFKDEPWYGSMDTWDSITNDDNNDDNDNDSHDFDNCSEDTIMKLHHQVECDSKYYLLIDDLIDGLIDEGLTESQSNALVDLIQDALEEDFQLNSRN